MRTMSVPLMNPSPTTPVVDDVTLSAALGTVSPIPVLVELATLVDCNVS